MEVIAIDYHINQYEKQELRLIIIQETLLV